MLVIKNLGSGYGDLQVLRDINLSVKKGEMVSILGANAAGKTTLINTLSGLVKTKQGQIIFAGEDITDAKPAVRVEKGLIQVCEGRNLFPMMTVEENLGLGAYCKRARPYLKENIEKVYELLPMLHEKRKLRANLLSGGQQQMVAIGRGLMASPKILMLDEPSMGLAPVIVDTLFETIGRIKATGATIILVEQNVVRALSISDRGYVLENGQIRISGLSSDLLKNEDIRAAYMGI